MDRLTKRENDIVYMVKDGELLAPMAMSGQEVRQVLQRLADYEDGEHGKWIRKHVGNGWDDWNAITCSKCSFYIHKPDFVGKYCPNCGAKMDGGV